MSSLNKQKIDYPEASLTLAISATEGRLALVLGREAAAGAELLAAQDWQATAQGVEILASALKTMLETLKLTPRHIGRIAAVNGPGSFTGLRLAITTAAGLARAIGATQAPLPYLPLLAANAVELYRDSGERRRLDEIWVLTYARRELVYAQRFMPQVNIIKPKSDILVLTLQEAVAVLAERATTICGSGLSKNRAFFAEALPNARLLGPLCDQPSASFLLSVALKATYEHADILPLYSRGSDAEENLPQIAERLGLDPEAAQKRLDDLLSSTPKSCV